MVKICNCDTREEDMMHEFDITKRISSADPCLGHAVLATAIEAFVIESPQATNTLPLSLNL